MYILRSEKMSSYSHPAVLMYATEQDLPHNYKLLILLWNLELSADTVWCSAWCPGQGGQWWFRKAAGAGSLLLSTFPQHCLLLKEPQQIYSISWCTEQKGFLLLFAKCSSHPILTRQWHRDLIFNAYRDCQVLLLISCKLSTRKLSIRYLLRWS